jgi:hypothetical protein
MRLNNRSGNPEEVDKRDRKIINKEALEFKVTKLPIDPTQANKFVMKADFVKD